MIICILCAVCIRQAVSVRRTHRQLQEWLDYLKEVGNAPERKNFSRGKGILAEINFELNDILEENRKQFARLAKAEEAGRQILTGLSHDVRTPLASLTGYLEAWSKTGWRRTAGRSTFTLRMPRR